jgi:hypothetical protein
LSGAEAIVPTYNQATGLMQAAGRAINVSAGGLFPSRAIADAAFPVASYPGAQIAIGTAAPYEIRQSNGKQWVVTMANLTASLRAVATAARQPNNFASASKQHMARSRHIARSRITSMQLVLANWYVDPTTWVETAPGATATVNVGLEVNGVNVGVFTLSAVAAMSIPDGGQIVTDALTCNLYPGDVFYLRTYYQNTAGIIYQGNTVTATRPAYVDTTNGEDSCIAVSGLADQSAGTGALTGTHRNDILYTPVVIVGSSTDPAPMLLGDSEVVGIGDGYIGTSGDRGVLARPIGPYLPYSVIAVGGDGAVKFVASHAKRLALKTYFTHVLCNYGVNDITNFARTPAQVVADVQTIAGYFTGMPFFWATLTPDSTSTDNFATVANQTPVGTAANLNSLNALIRAIPSGVNGVFELSDVLSSTRDSNKWISDGNVRTYTADGLHGTTVANELIRTSGAINPSVLAAY